MQEISVPIDCPSFSSYSSVRITEIADKVIDEFNFQREEFNIPDEDQKTEEILSKQISLNNDDDDDFEFAFVTTNPNTSSDEIFSNGQIKPIFPIFNTNLFLNHNNKQKDEVQESCINLKKTSSSDRFPIRRNFNEENNLSSSSSSSLSSSSDAEDLESVPSGTYCIWTPKINPSSSGSKAKQFRLKNLIKRSKSAINVTSIISSSPSLITSSSNRIIYKESEISKMKTKKKVVVGRSSSMASLHDIHYLKNKSSKDGERKRSYLPYKRNLISLF